MRCMRFRASAADVCSFRACGVAQHDACCGVQSEKVRGAGVSQTAAQQGASASLDIN
jgi:hypothetical protein